MSVGGFWQENAMAVRTTEGSIEDGQIRLPNGLRLPDRAKVYIVIPDEPEIIELPLLPPVVHLRSPRLADPKDAARLVKTPVTE
jgi:hypothetical protein